MLLRMVLAEANLATQIKERRVACGFSLRAAARAADLSPSTLSRWESGFCLPRVPELRGLLRALSMNEEEVIQTFGLLNAPRGSRVFTEGETSVRRKFTAPTGGSLIRVLRSRAKLSLADVAQMLEVNISTVSRWESSSAHPSAEQTHRLLDLLNAPTDFRNCLEKTGAGKLWVDWPTYESEGLEQRLERLERGGSGGMEYELEMLQLQASIWWYSERTWGTPVLQRTLVLYGEWLVSHGRYREGSQQAHSALESGLEPYGALGLRAFRILARSDVYRWATPRPLLGLHMLEVCLSRCGDGAGLDLLSADIAEFQELVRSSG